MGGVNMIFKIKILVITYLKINYTAKKLKLIQDR